MKIEVGIYVRTDVGIATVHGFKDDKVLTILTRNHRVGHYFTVLKEPSYDIIDLIEKDDVIAYYNNLQDIKGLIIERVQDNDYIKRLREFVKTGTINIVQVMTKEQFENLSYKIGE